MRILAPPSLRPPAGAYSHAVVAAGLIHIAGTVGVTPEGNITEGVEDQTLQTIDNIEAILAEANAGLTDIVSATVYLADMADYRAFANTWTLRFGGHHPARATVRAELVHPSLKVEIQAIAVEPTSKQQ